MSLSDAVGKLQGILSSFATEETKKTEKKEEVSENSVFSSALEDVNEESDITGIEIDYSQAASDVAEQLFINREINRNANDAKDFKKEVSDNLLNADIPEELKDELAPLYNQLCECTNINKRDQISAKIKQICLQAEKEGVDGKYLERLDLDLQLTSIHSSNAKSISELYEVLAEELDSSKRFEIETEIQKRQSENEIEAHKAFNQLYIREFNLSDEQVDGLSKLYGKLDETEDKNSRAKINDEIKKFCLDQGIDYNGEMIQGLNYNAAQIPTEQQKVELYDKLSSARSDKQKDMIYRELNVLNTQSNIELGQIEQKMILAGMDIDDESKEKVLDLFDELTGVYDRNETDKINAEIAQVLVEAGVDLKGRDYSLLQLTGTSLQKEKEILPIVEELLVASDPKLIEELNQKLAYIEKNYDLQFEQVHENLANVDVNSYQNELTELYDELSNTVSIDERNRIISEITEKRTQIDEIELNNSVQNILKEVGELGVSDELMQKLSFFSNELFFNSDSDVKNKIFDEISHIMCQAKAEGADEGLIDKYNLELQYSLVDVAKNNELKELYAELSETTSSDDRDRINARIQQKVAEYEKEKDCIESKMFMADIIHDSYSREGSLVDGVELPEEAKEKFIEQYQELLSSDDINERKSKLDELRAVVAELDAEYGFDPNGQVMRSIELNELETSQNIELAILYDDLSNTNSIEERDRINNKIREVCLRYDEEIKQKGREFWLVEQQESTIDFFNNELNSSNLPNEEKEKLISLYNDLVISQDENERNYLFDKLRQKFLEYDKSHGFDSDDELLNKLKKTELNLHFKFEIAKFKEQLQKTNSEDEIEYLNAKIRQMELQYQKEIDY